MQLHKRVDDLGKENDSPVAEAQKHKSSDGDVKEALEQIDKLLEHLPHDVLETFVQSDDFKIIEKIFFQYGVGK